MTTTTDNEHSFASCYMELCRRQHTRPLPMICVTLPHALDFTTDRVKMDDWTPILNALSLDRTLRSISVRSKFQYRKLLEHANSESKARAVSKAPVVLTRFLVEWLSHSLGQCLRNSSALTSLEIEGVPIPPDCLAALCVGLAGTKSLRHLSLQRCHIGDTGCEFVCRHVVDVHTIRSLDLSQCDLTAHAGTALAAALSRQKLALYHDAWKQSLRYREPKLDAMPGLRRLTLNGNPKLGNEAITAVIDAIRDSLWFKALDLQQCGLTDAVTRDLLDLLEHNKTLAVVDVRLNSSIREDSLSEIGRRLDRNNLQAGSKSEYQWLSLPQSRDSASSSGAKRVSSAGNLPKQKQQQQQQDGGKSAAAATTTTTTARPKSAIVRQVKRPAPPIVYRKPLLLAPAQQIAKRMRPKPPVLEKRARLPMKPPEHARVPQPEAPAKVSLHLDLQSQFQSPVQNPAESSRPPSRPDSALVYERPAAPSTDKLQETIRELLETQEERDRLREELRSKEHAIAEERARREFAEAKLRAAKTDLGDVEQTLRQRDQDSRGYLLVSQKSMQEICLSFARLLDMLEQQQQVSEERISRVDSDEGTGLKEDIRRRFALIIRKTKSENLKRGHVFVDEDVALPRLQLTARYGRSEGDIGASNTAAEPAVDARISRNIGDTGEARQLSRRQEAPRYEEPGLAQMKARAADGSPRERARALFASIISGGALLNFAGQRR